MSKVATKVKDLEGWNGEAALYKMTPPLEGHEYVAVSAVDAAFSGPETYIFPADSEGEVTSWCEITGSFRGRLSHEHALRNAGYEIAQVTGPAC